MTVGLFLAALCLPCFSQPTISAAVNSATYAKDQPLAPRGIAVIFGRNLTDGTSCLPPSCGPLMSAIGPLSAPMAGATVHIDFQPATLLYATPTQLAVQLPATIEPGNRRIQVNVNGVSGDLPVVIASSAAGIFTQNQQGTGAAVITHVSGAPVTEDDPAAPGEMVVMYGTGFGKTSPPLQMGQAPALMQPAQTYAFAAAVQVLVGGVPARIAFAGASPCCVGLDQINFEIPQGSGSDRAISVVVAKAGASAAVTMAVRGSTAPRRVASIACSMSGTVATCTVTLDGPAGPDGVVVWLKSSNAGLAAPETITIPAGQTSAKFSVDAGLNVSAVSGQFDAVLNGAAQTTATVPAALPITWIPIGPVGVSGGLGDITSGKLQAFAVAPSNANVMYAGGGLGPGNQGPLTHAGAFRSDDGGKSWKAINTGLKDPVVNTLWVDSANANVALAGTEFTGLYRTTDGGAHWTLVADYARVSEIAPWKDGLIAATEKGIIRSADAGLTWSMYYPTGEMVRVLSIGPQTLLAGGENGSVFVQGPGDSAPKVVYSDRTRTVWSAAVDPGDPSNLFLVFGWHPSRLVRSRDGGKTWTDVQLPNGSWAQSITFQASPRVLYAVSGGGALKSTDGGTTWTQVEGSGWDIRRAYPLGGAGVVMATDQGLHRSDDGRTWRALSPTVNNYLLTGLAVSGKRMLAGVQDFSGFASSDGGITWVQPTTYPAVAPVGEDGSVLFHPTDSRYCYAYTTGGVQYSKDGCKTFQVTNSPALADGVTYEQPGGTQILAVDPAHPEVIYAASAKGVFRSADYGLSFVPTGWPLDHTTAIAIDPLAPNIMYVGSMSGVYRTGDGGARWTKVLDGLNWAYPTTIAINPKDPEVVIVGMTLPPSISGGGIFRSVDRGNTFQPANKGLPTTWKDSVCCARAIWTVRFQPASASGLPLVALATEYGMFLSLDLGQSWQDIRSNAVPLFFTDIAWDGGYLYVSTYGQGVLRSAAPATLAAR